MNSRFGVVHPEIAICIWSLADCPARGMYGSVAKGTPDTSMAKGTPAPSHHSGLIPHPSPATNSEISKHQPKAGFVLLVGASYHKLLNFTHVFSLLSCSGGFAEAVVSQMCTLQNRGISTLSSERQNPFQQVPQTLWPCAQSKSQQKKLIQHIRNKGYQSCQKKY